jgi:hypothetical protein
MDITLATDKQWEQALDLALLDADEYANWLYGECYQHKVDESTADRLIRWLVLDRPVNVGDFDVATINYVILTGPSSVVHRAIFLLRKAYEAEMQDVVEGHLIDIMSGDEEFEAGE